MSDALSSALRSANVLSSIANPTVVNPLAAYSGAVNTAEGVMRLRDAQATQAWGQALQAATDPQTGIVDYPKAQRLAAGNPMAQMGMARNLANASELTGQQLNRNLAANAALGNAVSGVLRLPDNQLSQGVLGQVERLVSTGIITRDQANASLLHMSSDPGQLRTQLETFRTSLLPPGEQQQSIYGTLGTQTGPGGNTIGTRQAPISQGGGVSAPPQPGAPLGVAPGPGGLVDATVMTPNGPQKIQIPYEQAFPRGAAGGQGGQPPTPPAPGTTIPGAYQPRGGPGGGAGGATPPAAAPTPTTPQAPPGAAPGAPAAPASPVIQTPSGPAVTTSAPAGTEQDIQQYKAAQAAMPEQQRNIVAGQTALDALRLARTGPGTDTVNHMKAFLLAQGIDLGAIDPNSTAAYEIARKNLLRFAQGSAQRSLGTDLGLTTQLQSNANVENMLNSANDHILVQDMGLAKQRIAQTLEAPQGGVGMGQHTQNFTNTTDPRAFAWDLYSPAERNAIIAEASKTKGGLDKLDKSLEIAAKHNLIKMPTQANAQQ